MQTATDIDWTLVVNFDNHGSHWGHDTVEQAELGIDEARAKGVEINEWYMRDRDGARRRIVRIADPEFLDTICVFPDECDDCGAPVASNKWISDEHHAKCPHRDPLF